MFYTDQIWKQTDTMVEINVSALPRDAGTVFASRPVRTLRSCGHTAWVHELATSLSEWLVHGK